MLKQLYAAFRLNPLHRSPENVASGYSALIGTGLTSLPSCKTRRSFDGIEGADRGAALKSVGIQCQPEGLDHGLGVFAETPLSAYLSQNHFGRRLDTFIIDWGGVNAPAIKPTMEWGPLRSPVWMENVALSGLR